MPRRTHLFLCALALAPHAVFAQQCVEGQRTVPYTEDGRWCREDTHDAAQFSKAALTAEECEAAAEATGHSGVGPAVTVSSWNLPSGCVLLTQQIDAPGMEHFEQKLVVNTQIHDNHYQCGQSQNIYGFPGELEHNFNSMYSIDIACFCGGCEACAPGTFSDTVGAAACMGTPCEAGTFGSAGAHSASSATCTACPVGQYQGKAGAEGCVECSGGLSTGAPGARNSSACNVCPDGMLHAPAEVKFHGACDEGRTIRDTTTCRAAVESLMAGSPAAWEGASIDRVEEYDYNDRRRLGATNAEGEQDGSRRRLGNSIFPQGCSFEMEELPEVRLTVNINTDGFSSLFPCSAVAPCVCSAGCVQPPVDTEQELRQNLAAMQDEIATLTAPPPAPEADDGSETETERLQAEVVQLRAAAEQSQHEVTQLTAAATESQEALAAELRQLRHRFAQLEATACRAAPDSSAPRFGGTGSVSTCHSSETGDHYTTERFDFSRGDVSEQIAAARAAGRRVCVCSTEAQPEM